MVNIAGTDVNLPVIDITGALSTSWIYVFVIGVIGFVAVVGIAIMLFMTTYNRKIELYENVSGRGYSRTRTVLCRRIKLGRSGQEVLKTMNGDIFSAYGKKTGRNTYAFAKGQDGYWYNFVHGDLDAKFGTLDIEPTDTNVRMFHLGVDKVAQTDYAQKKGFIEKYGMHMIMAFLVMGVLFGFYIIAGKINEGLIASNNPEVAKVNKETAQLLSQLLVQLDSAERKISSITGIIQASDSGGG